MKHTQLFSDLIKRLDQHYGTPAKPRLTDPLGLIMYENIAYLVPDEKRDAAFANLRKEVGLKPAEILSAPRDRLIEIISIGGVQPERRAARLQEIARIVLHDFAGDLRSVLKFPFPEARKKLQLFPSIGIPGAEKILLFTKTFPVLGLESNGLRVLLRLGYGEEKRSYAASYASVQQALADEIGSDCDFLIRAHQLLRQHGKELCKRNHPVCEECPLRSTCRYYLQIKTA
jgi:endonuclease III